MSDYALRISFKSNEHPWSTEHKPIPWHAPKTDEEAIEWARGMAKGLEPSYSVTLLRDDQMIDFKDQP